MSYVIEKNVPMSGMGRKPHPFPFSEMDVGDSFECEDIETARQSAYHWGKTRGCKFSHRVTDKLTGAGRIWRVA